DKYEILAKAPDGVAIGDLTPNRNSVPVNIDALRPMLRALIMERFQMAAHMDEKPMEAYTLVANKPKLSKADPASRTGWEEAPGALVPAVLVEHEGGGFAVRVEFEIELRIDHFHEE